MAKAFKLNRNNFARVFLQSDRVRAVVHNESVAMAARVAGATGDETNVNDGGIKRARSYVQRRGSGARGEAKDGALLRSMRG